MKRKEGYYWVKFDKQEIAHYNPRNKYYPFKLMNGIRYMESDFDEIGDRIPMPDEVCEWKENYDEWGSFYTTSCGRDYVKDDSNNMSIENFCPHCGRKIKVIGS